MRWSISSGRAPLQRRQVPWAGQFRDYVRHDGVLVPGWGEASWYIDGQWRPVWRGTVVHAALE